MGASPHSVREVLWGLTPTRQLTSNTSDSTFGAMNHQGVTRGPLWSKSVPGEILMPETCCLKPDSVVRPLDAL